MSEMSEIGGFGGGARDMEDQQQTDEAETKRLPRGVPLYGFFSLPRGRLLKVCAEPCTFAPGYIQSNKPRWPSGAQEKQHG